MAAAPTKISHSPNSSPSGAETESVFIDDAQWKALWLGADRCYVVASDYAMPRFEKLVGKAAVHPVVASGGKVVLTNLPL